MKSKYESLRALSIQQRDWMEAAMMKAKDLYDSEEWATLPQMLKQTAAVVDAHNRTLNAMADLEDTRPTAPHEHGE